MIFMHGGGMHGTMHTNFGYIAAIFDIHRELYTVLNKTTTNKDFGSAISFTHRLYVLLEREEIIETAAERPTAVVDGVAEHSE